MADEKENILNQTSSCIDTLKKLYRHGTRFTVYFSARINKGLSFLPYTHVYVWSCRTSVQEVTAVVDFEHLKIVCPTHQTQQNFGLSCTFSVGQINTTMKQVHDTEAPPHFSLNYFNRFQILGDHYFFASSKINSN